MFLLYQIFLKWQYQTGHSICLFYCAKNNAEATPYFVPPQHLL